MVDVDEVAKNIYQIDGQACSIPKLSSVYLLNEEKKALIDSGPPSSASIVLDGLRQVGVKPEDINYIIVTHIHLDHGGGAGVLLKDMPQAQVVVHYRGAKHLIEPAGLIEGAIRVQGAEVIARYGKVVPVEPNRVQVVHGNETIRLSEGQVLDFIDAPGHAPHELCIYERRNGGIFVGDAVGLCLADGEVFLPGHPPPSFDMEVCINTIRRLMTLSATRLYFAHFGTSGKVQEILQMAIDSLWTYLSVVSEAFKENALDDVTERVMTQAKPKLEPMKKIPGLYEFVTENLVPAFVAGFVHYYQRQSENRRIEKYESNQGENRK